MSADAPAYAMPAAAWAAKSGDPVLFIAPRRASRPRRAPRCAPTATRDIYVLGPPPRRLAGGRDAACARSATSMRIGGPDPVRNAIAFARFADGSFGWGVVDPGHGLVLARADRPLDAIAATPLSAHGTTARCCSWRAASALGPAVEAYLLDIQPGYRSRPGARGLQSRLDRRGRPGAGADGAGPPGRAPRDRPVTRPSAQGEHVPVSQAEHPDRLQPRGHRRGRARALRRLHPALRAAAAQPHRPAHRATCRADHPARIEGEREIARLTALGFTGEVRGHPGEEGLPPLPSVAEAPSPGSAGTLHG